MRSAASTPGSSRRLLPWALVLTALLMSPWVLGDGMIGNPPIASNPEQAVAPDTTLVEESQASTAPFAWETLVLAAWTALTVL